MTPKSIVHLLEQNNLPFGDQTAAAATLTDAFEQCFRALCPDCAKGMTPDRNGSHILETIQGMVSWDRTCQAHELRKRFGCQ